MRTLRVSALLTGFALTGCGGSSGSGVESTPTPASYTKIVDMSGNRTFQTAGVQYNSVPATGFTNGTSQPFGSGVTVAYTEASDSYLLTAPDGTTVTFGPSNALPPSSTTPNTQQWAKVTGTTQDQLALIVPTVNGVALSYTILGSWGRIDTTTGASTIRLAVGGAPTLAGDMPRTGTATYSTTTRGAAWQNGTNYTLTGNSSATFSANFANNSVATGLTLAGTAVPGGTSVVQFGAFSGTGTISGSGPGFTGAVSGNGATGGFSGAFFGPKALEMGYDWYLAGTGFNAVGTVTGLKQ